MIKTPALHLSRREFIATSATTALTASAFGSSALASTFPSRDIELLLGVGPGGGTDRSARLIGRYWESMLPGNQRVTYVPRQGAGGLIALQALLDAPPDGHTVMFYPVPHIASFFQLGQIPDMDNDAVGWIGTLFNDPNVLLVPADSPYETIADFIDAARNSSEPFTISGSTPLSNAHFSTVLVRELTGANLQFVPFGGGGDARNAVAGGHVDGCIAPYWSALGVLELTKAIGIFQDSNPAPDLWQPVPANDVLDVEIPALSEPYAMFCSAAVRDENPEAFSTLVSSFKETVNSNEFRAAAASEDLAEFLVDWDADATSKFVEEYVALVDEYLPIMRTDVEEM